MRPMHIATLLHHYLNCVLATLTLYHYVSQIISIPQRDPRFNIAMQCFDLIWRALCACMQDCPPGDEQNRLALLQNADAMEEPPAFRAAVLHACHEAGRLPTYASCIKWRLAFLVRHGALEVENHANPFQGGMLLNALHGDAAQQAAAHAHLEHVQLLQAMVMQIAEQVRLCPSDLLHQDVVS
jgi:hypothetical protein